MNRPVLDKILIESTHLDTPSGRERFFEEYSEKYVLKWAFYCFDRRRINQLRISDINHVVQVITRTGNTFKIPCLSTDSLKIIDNSGDIVNHRPLLDYPNCLVTNHTLDVRYTG